MGSGWRGGGQGGGARGAPLASAEPLRTCGCRHPAGRAVAAASALAGAAHTFMRPLLPRSTRAFVPTAPARTNFPPQVAFFFFLPSLLPSPPSSSSLSLQSPLLHQAKVFSRLPLLAFLLFALQDRPNSPS